MDLSTETLTAEIRGGRRHGLARADLRGADLRRIELSCVSLHHARLDGANLEEAILECVDLSHASLAGVRLHRAHLDHVKATGAILSGARIDHAMIGGTDLSHADLSSARLEQAFFRNSSLERAILDDAILDRGKIAYTNCTGASFRRTDLNKVLTVGSAFFLAELATARRFFLCRDIVAEILQREAENDFEDSRLVGVVATSAKWCYRDWKAWLDFHPALRERAIAALAKYPDSGCREALLEGYAGPPPDVI